MGGGIEMSDNNDIHVPDWRNGRQRESLNENSDFRKDPSKIEMILSVCFMLLILSLIYLFYWRDLWVIWALVAVVVNFLLWLGEDQDSSHRDTTVEKFLADSSVFDLLMTYSFNLVCLPFLALGFIWLLFSSEPLKIFNTPFAELTLGALLLGFLKIIGIALVALLILLSIGVCVDSTQEYRQWARKVGIRWNTPLVLFLCSLLNAGLIVTALFRFGRLVLARAWR